MRRIFAIGETVYDIIFKDGNPVAAKAGGSTLNTSVSLGRLGLDVSFISDLGDDKIGGEITGFLSKNGVNTDHVRKYKNYKSSLAIAFLDDRNNASYTFYRDYPEERLTGIDISFSKNDIFLFGSFFALTPEVRGVLMKIVKDAINAGCIIIYDPNFRKAHLHELDKLRPFISENIRSADIVKGSDEDFSHIYNADDPVAAYGKISSEGCGNLIYTSGDKGVTALSGKASLFYNVPSIEVVSTIGAGDNFNAGIIWSIVKNGFTRNDLINTGKEVWDKLILSGIEFATEVCKSYENYIPVQFAKERIISD